MDIFQYKIKLYNDMGTKKNATVDVKYHTKRKFNFSIGVINNIFAPKGQFLALFLYVPQCRCNRCLQATHY